MNPLADAQQRQMALDITQSFIVQAPAGSGKTELLVQRYLSLLSKVSTPEAVVAITFTRKAAEEMRTRILDSLKKVSNGLDTPVSENVYDIERTYFAKKVLLQDQAHQWGLLAYPNRLRIQTIDSFCQSLTRQMPLSSKLNGSLTPIENPDWLYRLAVQSFLNLSIQESIPSTALIHLLSHLDNNFQHIEHLLCRMLSQRDQWLHYFIPYHHKKNLRPLLEKNLASISHSLISELTRLMPSNLRERLHDLLNFLSYPDHKKPLEANQYIFWKTSALFLLTETNEWRRQFGVKQGFPSLIQIKNKTQKEEYRVLKQQAVDLIAELKEHSKLKETLIQFKKAPPLKYTDAQWQTLESLFEILPILTAHLKLIFQEQGKVDHIEIFLTACTALGQAENPSDLALYLDTKIEHLLIDEFQDTSSRQLHFIEKLTAGWQAEDSRTLFVVGDPMQSIYRFRKAEASLFEHVQRYGIAHIHLRSLCLSVNFRSHPDLVDWVNTLFLTHIPRSQSPPGPISFAPAVAFQTQPSDASSITAVHYYWRYVQETGTTQQNEANTILEIIQKIQKIDPAATIAILVRARSHLTSILPTLTAAHVPYQGLEVESLSEKPFILDLLSLTRALYHLGDRISWFALLRSPYCGLTLAELYQITQISDSLHPLSLWDQLCRFKTIVTDKDTRQRLRRIIPVLQLALEQRGRTSSIDWIKETWIRLGGPTCLKQLKDRVDVNSFFNFLEKKIAQEGSDVDLYKIKTDLSQYYTRQHVKATGQTLDIMSIHKAKGLEYDHIILPSLHRKPTHNIPPLVLYNEYYDNLQRKIFLLAPINASHEQKDSIYDYLLEEEKKKLDQELNRLLYVASTRAKKSLHLLGEVQCDAQGLVKKPHPHSLLYRLWPLLKINSKKLEDTVFSSPLSKVLYQPKILKRLKADWEGPKLPLPVQHTFSPTTYRWLNPTARILGRVVHRLMYYISQEGLGQWDKKENASLHPIVRHLLRQEGLNASQENEALQIIERCIRNILSDPKGRWILCGSHKDAYAELALTGVDNGKTRHIILDRTFIDHSTGERWIIDYKTQVDEATLSPKLANSPADSHKKQLEDYAKVMWLDPEQRGTPIRLGLYFPLTLQWYEWYFRSQPHIVEEEFV